MSHFANVPTLIDGKGIVTEVIVADQSFIDAGHVGDPSTWWQTSYNTKGNVHYGNDGQPDGGVAFRANFAGDGFILDSTVVINGVTGVFYPPQPGTLCTLNTSSWLWESPTP